nr:squalene synthase-like [Anolis sagrei ordinatus]
MATASKAAVSFFKRSLALSPPRGGGRGSGRCSHGAPGSSLGSGGSLVRLQAASPSRPRFLSEAPPAAKPSPPSPSPPGLFFLQDSLSHSLRLCYKYLNQTSRSFAAVIQALDGELRFRQYCHYVAGLVGIGLSQLFSASKLEDPIVGQDMELANSMGLFLQKTNIIRDYYEDQLVGREFWPREVWSKYAKKVSDLAKPENIDKAVQCMNELITNALHHVPDVLTYLSRLKNQSVFNFCAIPQVMAIATLAACYNNQQVFRGVVKIRKGQAVTLMMDATNIQAVKAIMYQYVEEIYQKIPSTDPSSSRTQQIVASVRSMSLPGGELVSRTHYSPIYLSCVMLLVALSWQYLSTVSQAAEEFVHTGEN